MRRFLVVLVGLMVLATTGLAGAQQVSAAQQISLPEAVALALQEDIGHQIALVQWDNAKVAYERSLADNLLTGSAYNARLAEYTLKQADTEYRGKVADVVVETVTQFADLAQADLTLQIREKELALAKKQLELTRQKRATQNASELDVLEAESALATAEANYQQANDNLAQARRNFQFLLGGHRALPDGNLPFVPLTVDLDDLLQRAIAESVTVKQAEENVELVSLDLEQLELEQAAPLVLREARNKVKLAQLQLAQAKERITNEVTSAYNSVNQAARRYRSAQQSLELETRTFAITKQQLEAGLKTADELDRAQIALWQATSAELSARKDYVLAYLAFERSLDRDLSASVLVQPPAEVTPED
ncbi:MAG: TolC family protein [Firmicutes bacterium]|nr:TolC family protein [Bacillota bacterium]